MIQRNKKLNNEPKSINKEREPDFWITPNTIVNLCMVGCSQYCVTPDGRILNIRTKKYLAPFKDRRKYHNYSLWCDNGQRKTFRVHRLVAMAYVPIPKDLMPKGGSTDDLSVNHIDMNVENNHYTNLEWCMLSENDKEAMANRSIVKLDDKTVETICLLLMMCYRNRPIAEALNVSETQVQSIRHKKSYNHICDKYNFPKDFYLFTKLQKGEHERQVQEIKKWLKERHLDSGTVEEDFEMAE